MKILVCGGRDFSDRDLMYSVLDKVLRKFGRDNLCILHGAAKGADLMAEEWCKSRQVKYIGDPAWWDDQGKAAGMIRNRRMAHDEQPDQCIAFPGGVGTAGMVSIMRRAGIEPWIIN